MGVSVCPSVRLSVSRVQFNLNCGYEFSKILSDRNMQKSRIEVDPQLANWAASIASDSNELTELRQQTRM